MQHGQRGNMRQVVLGQEDSFLGVSQPEGDDEMYDMEEAPSVYHLRVLGHVDPVIDGDAFFRQRISEMLRESLFELAVAGGRQGELGHYPAGLHEGVLDLKHKVWVDRHREAMANVFIKELPDLDCAGLGGLVISSVDIGLELGLALGLREMRFESVVHAVVKDQAEESKVGM
jgi:hypothetical protein